MGMPNDSRATKATRKMDYHAAALLRMRYAQKNQQLLDGQHEHDEEPDRQACIGEAHLDAHGRRCLLNINEGLQSPVPGHRCKKNQHEEESGTLESLADGRRNGLEHRRHAYLIPFFETHGAAKHGGPGERKRGYLAGPYGHAFDDISSKHFVRNDDGDHSHEKYRAPACNGKQQLIDAAKSFHVRIPLDCCDPARGNGTCPQGAHVAPPVIGQCAGTIPLFFLRGCF